MLMITLYAEQKKRHRCIEQSLGILGAFLKYLFSGASWGPTSLAHVRERSHLSICARGQD